MMWVTTTRLKCDVNKSKTESRCVDPVIAQNCKMRLAESYCIVSCVVVFMVFHWMDFRKVVDYQVNGDALAWWQTYRSPTLDLMNVDFWCQWCGMDSHSPEQNKTKQKNKHIDYKSIFQPYIFLLWKQRMQYIIIAFQFPDYVPMPYWCSSNGATLSKRDLCVPFVTYFSKAKKKQLYRCHNQIPMTWIIRMQYSDFLTSNSRNWWRLFHPHVLTDRVIMASLRQAVNKNLTIFFIFRVKIQFSVSICWKIGNGHKWSDTHRSAFSGSYWLQSPTVALRDQILASSVITLHFLISLPKNFKQKFFVSHKKYRYFSHLPPVI